MVVRLKIVVMSNDESPPLLLLLLCCLRLFPYVALLLQLPHAAVTHS
jgi:hypothetical protein